MLIPWITPPEGVYNLIFDTFDGIGFIHSIQLGDFDTSIHVIYGSNKDKLTAESGPFKGSFTTKNEDLVGASITLNRDWLTLRGGYFTTKGTFPIPALESLSDLWLSTGFNDVAGHVKSEEDRAKFIEFAFQVDYNDFLITGEFTDLSFVDSPFSDQESYYVMFGKRFDEFMVHATYGKDDDSADYFTTGVPAGIPQLDALVAGTNQLVDAQKFDSKYTILGFRWDFHDSAAFKFEYKMYSEKGNTALDDVDLIRLALVTVF